MSVIDKHGLRQQALAARSSLSSDQRTHYSFSAIHRLLSYLEQVLPRPNALLVYRAMATEVDTESLLHLPDYQIYAPVAHRHDHMEWRLVTPATHWRKGVFGTLEPSDGPVWRGDADTVLIAPLSAFDRSGNRLGMGKGCFDRWLADERSRVAQVIGLAFACQEVASIPHEVHDVPMDMVITEQEVIACPGH